MNIRIVHDLFHQMSVLKQSKELTREIVTLRRDFYRYLKTGFEVCQISEVVAQYLDSSDLEVRSKVKKSGTVGVLKVK